MEEMSLYCILTNLSTALAVEINTSEYFSQEKKTQMETHLLTILYPSV